MEKVQQKTWIIALVHFLRGGMFVPIIASVVIGGPILFYISLSSHGAFDIDTTGSLLLTPIVILAAFAGGMYSARHIGRTYIITDANDIVRISAIFMVVILTLLNFSALLSNPAVKLIQIIGMTAVFYAASNKYIHNSSEVNDKQNI